jgi:hypothetical protein
MDVEIERAAESLDGVTPAVFGCSTPSLRPLRRCQRSLVRLQRALPRAGRALHGDAGGRAGGAGSRPPRRRAGLTCSNAGAGRGPGVVQRA